MHFLLIYHAGKVPEMKQEENIKNLWDWLNNLKADGIEISRFAGEGVKEISKNSIDPYTGDVFGVSIVECDSLEEAVSLTENWPELSYDGTIDILKALG